MKKLSKRSDELSFHVPSHQMLTVVSPLTALKNYQINSCERLALKCCIEVGGKRTPIRHIRPGFETVSWQQTVHAQ